LVAGPNDNGGVGAAWIFRRSAGTWAQQGTKLVGSGAVGNAQQGYRVALSRGASTAVVGGIDDNNNTGETWVWYGVPSCDYSVSNSGQAFNAAGGLGTFNITTTSNCGWAISFRDSWITPINPTVLPGALYAGTGTRRISYAVASNTGEPRTGTINVAGQT